MWRTLSCGGPWATAQFAPLPPNPVMIPCAPTFNEFPRMSSNSSCIMAKSLWPRFLAHRVFCTLRGTPVRRRRKGDDVKPRRAPRATAGCLSVDARSPPVTTVCTRRRHLTAGVRQFSHIRNEQVPDHVVSSTVRPPVTSAQRLC